MNLEVGNIVLCTVDRIVGTTVFVHIEGHGEGSIVFSEVAPGRIRNIRDYVVPKKQIVCKILRVSGDRVDLSLRRVTLKEQKELKEKDKVRKSYESVIKSVLGEKAKGIIEEISKKGGVYDFLQEAKENPKELENLAGRENAKKILEIISSQQKKKISVIKKEISLTTTKPDGIEIIKDLLGKIKRAEIKYIAAGRYSLRSESEDIKKADQELTNVLNEIEKNARKSGAEFSIIKK